jgi:hypothetical protein
MTTRDDDGLLPVNVDAIWDHATHLAGLCVGTDEAQVKAQPFTLIVAAAVALVATRAALPRRTALEDEVIALTKTFADVVELAQRVHGGGLEEDDEAVH